MFNYHKKRFNLYDGFNDNERSMKLAGDNKFFCSVCNKLQDAESTCKIFEPPFKLLICIDYGKNKKYQPSRVDFDEVIDINQFVDYKEKCKYRLICICSCLSGNHYVAFCWNKKENKWYEFNDASVREIDKYLYLYLYIILSITLINFLEF